ncbi:surface lipoprotein assembly modifier [Neomegalonema sp.]|uniref:surface lipoprotein assembly modifier n=1 Tax=Neomegalonema sp. TaxID=2039713 RepID=UPI00261716ED|nr:surface lipoprotein assembly modifier [Neomegalonema sp.]MDD2869922.1 surface lipoprotein assembly modifier [Neomegalonema sp.]
MRLLPSRRACAAALALLSLGLGAPARALSPAEVEARFLEALEAMAEGRPEQAAEIFGALPPESVTPRIKLERARALLFAGRHGEALRLFREVHDAPETPRSVRRNILPYLEAAELRSLRLRYGARLTTDSNPSRVSEGGTIFFNGVPLEYQPPAEKKTVTGVEPWVSLEKLWESDLLTKLHASASLFEDSDLNSARADLAIGRELGFARGVFLQASLAGEWAKNEGSFLLPSVEAWRRFRLSESARLGFGGQIGYLGAERADLSGGFYRGYVMGDWSLAPQATLFAQASLERRDSRNGFHAYTAPRLELGLSFEAGGFEATPRLSATLTRYDEPHLLIGAPRRDVTWRPMLTLAHEGLSWGGFRPELTLFHERRDSNVGIEEYDQFGAFLNLRRVY